MSAAARESSVFVNCPFDSSFRPLFDAIVFTSVFCGFGVRSALEVRDSGDLRLIKIIRMIEQSRFSIHDISRVELDALTGLPRFNMPIELGIALGMKYLGRAEICDHLLLVTDTERYRYQSFASDLAGVDIAAHHGDASQLIAEVRDFLVPHASLSLPGPAAIRDSHRRFLEDLPDNAARARQRPDELTFTERLHHIQNFLATLA